MAFTDKVDHDQMTDGEFIGQLTLFDWCANSHITLANMDSESTFSEIN